MTTPIRVGIIGCGNISVGYHLPAYAALPGVFEVVAVADPTPERRELAREAAGLDDADAYADAAELLARDDIDLVDVCTPQFLHRDVVVDAARSGKHVVCEKPIAASPADAAAMIAAAEEAGVVLAVVHNYLFFPEIVRAKSLVDEGAIGAVRSVQLDMLGVVDSPGAAGYMPQWRKDPHTSGGGVLMDMLHGVYLVQHLLEQPIERVSAWIDGGDTGAVESAAVCRIESADRVGLVNVAWGMGPGGVRIDGEQGRIVLDYREDGTMPWFPFETMTLTTEGRSEVVDLPAGEELGPLVSNALRDTLADVARAIDREAAPAASGAAALETLEITVAAYASAALGRSVAVPLDAGDALHVDGVMGLHAHDVPADSVVRRKGLFGFGG